MILPGVDHILLFGTYQAFAAGSIGENTVVVKLVLLHISLILFSSLVSMYVSVSLAHHSVV